MGRGHERQFHFYVEGLTDGVARVMESLDAERRSVGRGFGVDLPSLFDEMQAVGTIESNVDPQAGWPLQFALVWPTRRSRRRGTPTGIFKRPVVRFETLPRARGNCRD